MEQLTGNSLISCYFPYKIGYFKNRRILKIILIVRIKLNIRGFCPQEVETLLVDNPVHLRDVVGSNRSAPHEL